MKILIVEDNQINCFLLCDYLEYCGYHVQALSCGEHFFNAMDEFKPDLVLLDLKMPKVDGYSILAQLQTHPMWSSIPVIVVSALSFRTHQEKAMKLGARRYLTKPVAPSVLRLAIEQELAAGTTPTHSQNVLSKPRFLSLTSDAQVS